MIEAEQIIITYHELRTLINNQMHYYEKHCSQTTLGYNFGSIQFMHDLTTQKTKKTLYQHRHDRFKFHEYTICNINDTQ